MENFNQSYKDFLKYLQENLPSYKKHIIIKDEPGVSYLNFFVENNLSHMDEISVKNSDIFQYKFQDALLIKGLRFKRVIDKVNDKKISEKVLLGIWDYLHKLYQIAYDECNLQELYKDNEKVLSILEFHDSYIENIIGSIAELETEIEEPEKETSKSKKSEQQQGNPEDIPNIFEGTLIGDLAKEIAQDVDTSKLENMQNPQELLQLLMGGGNPMNGPLGDVMGSIVGKLQNKLESGEVDKEKLMTEALGAMGQLGQMGGQGGPGGMGDFMSMFQGMAQQAGGTPNRATKRKEKKIRRKKKK